MSGNVLNFPGTNPNNAPALPLSLKLMAAVVPLMMGILVALKTDQVLTMTIMMMLLYVIYIRKRKSPVMYILLSVFLILNLMSFFGTLPLLPFYIVWLGAVYGLLKTYRTEPRASEFIRLHLLQNIATFGLILLVTMLWSHLYQLVFLILKLFHSSDLLSIRVFEGIRLDTAVFYLLLLIALYPIFLLVIMPLLGKKPCIPFISNICNKWTI